MELVCQKYRETTMSDAAICRHPLEYCKFRTSCIIQFEERQRRLSEKREADEDGEQRRRRGSVTGE